MNEKELATKVIIHDGNGTWFVPSGLYVALLSTSEVHELTSGNTTVLDAFEGITLDTLLAEVDSDPTIEWAWNGSAG
jgi:hypothetical protein